MQQSLVNEEYLSNLIILAQEQDDLAFVPQLFENLQSGYHLFLRDCSPWLAQPPSRFEFQQRVHKLKNNFLNLGCEVAGSYLEQMYQVLKSEHFDSVRLTELMNHFEDSAEETFSHLSQTIAL